MLSPGDEEKVVPVTKEAPPGPLPPTMSSAWSSPSQRGMSSMLRSSPATRLCASSSTSSTRCRREK
jgi:hypothetical protein